MKVRSICKESEELGLLTVGKVYDVVRKYVHEDTGYSHVVVIDDEGKEESYYSYRFEDVEETQLVETPVSLDSHYNFIYNLSEKDKENGFVKIDPYFVNLQWNLSGKDGTGVLFHCLKNISRYAEKNTKEREIKALYLQVKRLAELEGVNLVEENKS